MNKPLGRKGFSLVEIIMVLAIMGVLIAVSIPFFLTWRSNNDLRNAADRLLSALRVAQSLSTRFAILPGIDDGCIVRPTMADSLAGMPAADGFVEAAMVDAITGGGTDGSTSSSGGSSSSSAGGTHGTSGGTFSSSSSSTGGVGGVNSSSSSGGAPVVSASGATVCTIIYKQSNDWKFEKREYVDAGFTVTLAPIVDFTQAAVNDGSQSALSVAGSKGIAFTSNGSLYSRQPTVLQLSNGKKTCTITVSAAGAVKLEQ